MSKIYNVSKNDMYKGSLILINEDHKIKNIICENDLVKIDNNKEILVNKQLTIQYSKLINYIKGSDEIIVTDGYRSHLTQKILYEQSIIDNGLQFTKDYVALVDCSEHQSGLAIDVALKNDNIDLIRPAFPNEKISKQFKVNCINFGFIERYKEHKKHLTKIAAEEWHFRYVGYPHSKLIDSFDFCLEQYIEHLKIYSKSKPLLYENYKIYYIKYEHNLKIKLSNNCLISGNNVDGFIMTEVIDYAS